jgi:heme A synthase
MTTAAPAPSQERSFRRYLIGVSIFTLGVILWGALVRITGSGAGCGQHWPTCHGELVPINPSIETFIEFFHRVTSGLCFLSIVVGLVLARRWYPRGHAVRAGMGWTMFFIVTESLIGAAIVLLKYVADNDSGWRAVWMAVHLANTFFLVYWMVVTLWWSWFPARFSLRSVARRSMVPPLLTGALLLVSMSGAVSALGHTLFPPDATTSALEHLRNDPWIHTNYPMLVRVVHPAVALLTTLGLWGFASRVTGEGASALTRRAAIGLATAAGLQVIGGLVSIAINAPGWMQLIHLAMANAVWVFWILTVFAWMLDEDSPATDAFSKAIRRGVPAP